MWEKAQYSLSFGSRGNKTTKSTEQHAPSAHLIGRMLRTTADAAANRPLKTPFSAKGWAETMRKNEIIINRSLKPGPGRIHLSIINLETVRQSYNQAQAARRLRHNNKSDVNFEGRKR